MVYNSRSIRSRKYFFPSIPDYSGKLEIYLNNPGLKGKNNEETDNTLQRIAQELRDGSVGSDRSVRSIGGSRPPTRPAPGGERATSLIAEFPRSFEVVIGLAGLPKPPECPGEAEVDPGGGGHQPQ